MEYTLWFIASVTLGIYYMYLILGPPLEPDSLITIVGNEIYFFALTRVGFIIGSIVFILFLLVDTTLLKSHLKSFLPQLPVRIVSLLALTVMVGMIHYLLEKTLDLI
ncbi:hypothetical protein SYJ56_18805 [Algoriphagus sp. D3-2-R+10]|uniref:hypothetical protein n=1 Tax=Algoriphagus aurantiacus TaxID=3103948 RepID=UPI002B3D8E37|nr:hypothetical protein [Algoriphagus sp. D3-2-R+10]MEB2777372.1 hypothetical protein [Algoriphagus sp. D3-2-R+10]